MLDWGDFQFKRQQQSKDNVVKMGDLYFQELQCKEVFDLFTKIWINKYSRVACRSKEISMKTQPKNKTNGESVQLGQDIK